MESGKTYLTRQILQFKEEKIMILKPKNKNFWPYLADPTGRSHDLSDQSHPYREKTMFYMHRK